MKLLTQFLENIQKNNLFSSKNKLLLAVSGGVDSVVLCELCKQAKFDFVIAHCNFRLRDKESERDKEFVKRLAEKYGVECVIKDFDTNEYATSNKLSVQEAARDLRYKWFNEILEGNLQLAPDNYPDTNPQFLLTAHHAGDNAETILMNFCRGTGLHGLTGIPAKIGRICRPLLEFSREEIMEFAKDNKLGYVEDSSNLSSKYTRNYFRNNIIPAIARVYPQIKDNLGDNINRFREIEKLYKLSVGEIKKKVCRQKGVELHIPVRQLMGFDSKALIYEIISPYGFSEKQLDEVAKLAESESGRYIQSPGNDYRIIRHRHWLIISPRQDMEAENILIEEGVKEVKYKRGTLTIQAITGSKSLSTHSTTTACLDAKSIQFPLLLRKWKEGDYFYPLGMKKKKKLSRFFIDQKLSKTEKEQVWVLESEQKIIWIVGHRIDDRFKLTEKTKNVLQIQLIPAK